MKFLAAYLYQGKFEVYRSAYNKERQNSQEIKS